MLQLVMIVRQQFQSGCAGVQLRETECTFKFTEKACFIYERFNSRKGAQLMSLLPSKGITEAPPFSITGLDFAGPLYTKESDIKYYICIFASSVTRAIHLELVPNQSILVGIRRFTSRGVCSTIYFDNAKTFKSAE